MAGNRFGQIFTLTSYGESHGHSIGGIIDGCPAGIELNFDEIQYQLDRRKPGQSKITTQRKESDKVQFLSGIFEGKTTGTPIAFMVLNEDQRSKDYEHNDMVFRPSHADFTYQKKYGIRDHRGGGRSSARETIARVVAGAIAKQVLAKLNIEIFGFVSRAGKVALSKPFSKLDFGKTETNDVRCPDTETAEKMYNEIEEARKSGDTVGGIVSAVIKNVPVGWGEPVFDKLHADLGKAMLSINAVKGFEYGGGFAMAEKKGSEVNDEITSKGTISNHSGGIQGGISNGEEIYFSVAFKPVATIVKEQNTINDKGEETTIKGKGRHDPCVVPRAVPIVEAMAAMVLLDHYLRAKSN